MSNRDSSIRSGGDLTGIAPQQFGPILASASDITIILRPDGIIERVAVNPANRSLGCLDHWEARPLREFLTEESRPKLEARIAALDPADPRAAAVVELNHVDNVTWEFPIRYTILQAGIGGRLILAGRDLRPIAEAQQQLVKAQLALERDQERYREFDTLYRVVMESVDDAVAIVNVSTGRITDLNASAAKLLGGTVAALQGASFAAQFEEADRATLADVAAAAGQGRQLPPVRTATARSGRRVAVHRRLFRAAGERLAACRLVVEDQAAQGADELSAALANLYATGSDAILLTDARGVIRHANEAFLALGDAALLAEVRGRSLADFLARGAVDLKVLLDNAGRVGRLRSYATRFLGAFGSEVPVEISATLIGENGTAGFVFVIRSGQRAAASEPPKAGKGGLFTDEDARSAMELVGSTPLRDILTATTDVVERICIETAIQLTRNNRAAAAEMLGLSRQSLYVKLRKYGLIDRDAPE